MDVEYEVPKLVLQDRATTVVSSWYPSDFLPYQVNQDFDGVITYGLRWSRVYDVIKVRKLQTQLVIRHWFSSFDINVLPDPEPRQYVRSLTFTTKWFNDGTQDTFVNNYVTNAAMDEDGQYGHSTKPPRKTLGQDL